MTGVKVTVPTGLVGPSGKPVVDNVKEYETVDEAKKAIDELIETWVTPEMYENHKDKSATITLTINGETVEYEVSLDNVK